MNPDDVIRIALSLTAEEHLQLAPGYRKLIRQMHAACSSWQPPTLPDGRPILPALAKLPPDSAIVGNVESVRDDLGALKNDSARALFEHVMKNVDPNTGTIMSFYMVVEYLAKTGALAVEWRGELSTAGMRKVPRGN